MKRARSSARKSSAEKTPLYASCGASDSRRCSTARACKLCSQIGVAARKARSNADTRDGSRACARATAIASSASEAACNAVTAASSGISTGVKSWNKARTSPTYGDGIKSRALSSRRGKDKN
ncbi:MAG: hypothetical protein DCC52_17815, partial [Chloroflexi bacterium]